MGLSKEEKAQLEALTKKSKEPDGPAGPVNFTLDLSSDAAWERAKKLGLVKDDDESSDDDDENDDDDDAPRRQSGYFGSNQ